MGECKTKISFLKLIWCKCGLCLKILRLAATARKKMFRPLAFVALVMTMLMLEHAYFSNAQCKNATTIRECIRLTCCDGGVGDSCQWLPNIGPVRKRTFARIDALVGRTFLHAPREEFDFFTPSCRSRLHTCWKS